MAQENEKRVENIVNRTIMSNISHMLYNERVIDFIKNDLPTVMGMVGVNYYAIGGSVASFLHGVNLGRNFHDIDIIVPAGTIEKVKNNVEKSIFLIEEIESSCCDEFKTNHYAFRAIKSMVIDLIESNDIKSCIEFRYPFHVNVMGIEELIASKKRYNRYKDIEDLKIMTAYYNAIVEDAKQKVERQEPKVEQTTLGDLDALAALKEAMERGK